MRHGGSQTRARFPDFLLIGSMKCGTTSLYFDLLANPGIFWPVDKEPGNLAHDRVLTTAGRSEYGALFASAGPGQVCGDASTDYSKRPDIDGVPERALEICGERLKILYLVREPISRVISHHFHEVAEGTVSPDIDRAVQEAPCLLDYTRYAMQIRPWIETFGRDHVRIVRFENFVADRVGSVADLSSFLGVGPQVESIRADQVHNRSVRRPLRRGPIWRFSRGDFYRTWIRPLVPRPLRTQIRRLLLPKAPSSLPPPSTATVEYILDELAGDLAELQRILGTREPLWDLDAVRKRYHRPRPMMGDRRAAGVGRSTNG